MYKFDLNEYEECIKVINEARSFAEKAAEEIAASKPDNIFFVGVGGSLAPMLSIKSIAQELTDFPLYFEQAAELILKGHKKLSTKSVVVTMSKSGDTKETVAIAKWCQEKGIPVVAITKSADSNLGKYAKWHIPMRHPNGVEFEYILLYWLFFKLMHINGDFKDYVRFADQLEILPHSLLKAKEKFENIGDAIAKEHHDSPYMIWISSGETWSEAYLFSMCILEEMQWKRTKSVTSPEFFHGTLELVEKGVSVFLIKSEGKCRVLDERVEKFAKQYTDKLVVIDTKDYSLEGVDDSFRWILSPVVATSLITERLAIFFEKYTGHDLKIRRYYRQFDY